MTAPTRARGLAALAVVALTTACGIPLDDEPRAVSGDLGRGVESGLPDSPDSSGETTPLFFVRAGGLVAVSQRVSDVQPSTVLDALLSARPGAAGFDKLITQIPSGTRLLDSRVRGGVLEVNLSGEFSAINGPALQLAVGQIVLSVTKLRDISNVTFRIDGRDATVSSPKGDAQLVAACDFVSLLAAPEGEFPATTTTTTTTTTPRRQRSSSTTTTAATTTTTAVAAPSEVAAAESAVTTTTQPDTETVERRRLLGKCPTTR